MSKNKNKLSPQHNDIGSPFIELQQVDSTNNYATALVHEGMAQHGTVVFAHHQIKGKGQRDRAWQAQKDENITLSLVLQPWALAPSQMFLLSKATAVGLFRFFSKYAGHQTKVKWPNDLYWRDRKAGGILIENILSGTEWKYAIVGIGVNINQTKFPGLGKKAVSLRQITGNQYDVLALAKELVAELQVVYREMIQLPSHVAAQYHDNLYKLNESVRLKKDSRVFDATIKGVSPLGQLITQSAVEEVFEVGDVEWITE